LTFGTNDTEKMRLDSSGNLGLGVTPSAWSTGNFKVLQIGASNSSGYLAGRTDGANNVQLGLNAYNNGTDYLYVNSSFASRYAQASGAHQWFNAPSGTAGNAITFTQAMTLDASGNLGIGTTAPLQKLDVRGIIATNGAYSFVANSSVPAIQVSMFKPADNTLAFGTASTERMRIDSSGNVGIGATANASAILDVQSTTKGVRMPNMTTTQKNAIASPAAGLMVFDTTLAKLCVYSGSAWETITSL
jgi:hypothetical protein